MCISQKVGRLVDQEEDLVPGKVNEIYSRASASRVCRKLRVVPPPGRRLARRSLVHISSSPLGRIRLNFYRRQRRWKADPERTWDRPLWRSLPPLVLLNPPAHPTIAGVAFAELIYIPVAARPPELAPDTHWLDGGGAPLLFHLPNLAPARWTRTQGNKNLLYAHSQKERKQLQVGCLLCARSVSLLIRLILRFQV